MSANRSQSIPAGAPVDLTNCDREPIHTPGAIQAHGALFALDPLTLRILAASENAPATTGRPLAQIVNARLDEVFEREVVEAVGRSSSDPSLATGAVTIPFSAAQVARLHASDDVLYLELEPAADGAYDGGELRDAIERFAGEDDLIRVCDDAAQTVRRMTGYDRVMIYRFDSDGHGSVIAEAREPSLDTFLGQHYPASDIPRQARELYRTTMLRLIVDVAYVPAPVTPLADARTGNPWNLGRAILRSVSPIHIQYLKNMGVTATLTVSLLRDGELWGLVAAHHYSPKYAGHELRAATEALGYALVSRIVALEDRASASLTRDLRAAIAAFTAAAGSDRARAVATGDALHAALGWDGAALAGGEVVCGGAAPDAARIRELSAWLDERKGADVFVTDNLARLNPEFRDIAPVASGVYGYHSAAGWLFGFRAEHEHEIVWGGDPNKAAAFDGERLTPRGSFEKWREEVHERAIPWQPEVLEALEGLGAWVDRGEPWT